MLNDLKKLFRRSTTSDCGVGPSDFLLIAGAMKCGTTSLYYCLVEHPFLCSCQEKEPKFLSREDLLDSTSAQQVLAKYRTLWPDWNPAEHKVAIEASTNYSKLPVFPNTAVRIRKLMDANPVRFRIIYLMRDPISALTSFYRYAMSRDRKWARRALDLLFERGDRLNKFPLCFFQYAMQLEPYFTSLPRDDILLLRFEDLVQKPQLVIREVCEFLELSDNVGWEQLEQRNSSRQKLERFFSRHPDRVYPGLTLEKALSWSLSERQKIQVREFLREDMRRLRNDYGVDISLWDVGEIG